jgi:hypothetical protein
MSADLILPGSLRVPVELGDSPYDAILDALQRCEADWRRPVRLDADDWLTLADIAARTGVSRELVRLWSIGKQGPGRFPPPLNPARDTKFYSWWETSAWIRRHTTYDPCDHPEPVLVAMNLALQLRRMRDKISRLDAVLECITG